MTSLLLPGLDAYVDQIFGDEAAIFAELHQETQQNTLYPGMLSGAIVGRFLRMLVQSSGARTVLEIGTFTGYSALWLASALPIDGKVITCDINPVTLEIAKRYFAQASWGHKVEVAVGPALDTLAKLKHEQQRLDFVFIDADKSNYLAYYEAALELLEPGGLIVADNTLWSGKVLDPQDDDSRALDVYNRRLASDSRVEAVLLSVRDGLTLARKHG